MCINPNYYIYQLKYIIGKLNTNPYMERLRQIYSIKILPYKSMTIVFGLWNIYLEFWLSSEQNVF